MKITYKTGDVTNASEEVIAHGCNCMGVMGSGVAAAIRTKFPEIYSGYVSVGKSGGLKLGENLVLSSRGKLVVNMMTQFGFGTHIRQVNYEAIFTCFTQLNGYADIRGFEAVAMPRIGAGLGGGNWNIIEAIIKETSTGYLPVVYDL